MSYTRYESSSYNRDDDVRDRNTLTGTGNNTTVRRSWDDNTDRSNTNNNGDLYFSRTTTYRDSDRDNTTGTSRPYTTGPFGTGSYTTGNTTNMYTRDSDYNRGNTTTTDRYATGTQDRYTGERGYGTTSSYDRAYPTTTDRYTTGPRTTGYTGDVERFNVDRSNDRGYTGETRGYTGETRGYTGETRGYYTAGSDVFNRRGCETCPDTYTRPTGYGHSATCDYNTRGGYGYTATTDYNRGYTDRDTYGPRNYDRDTTTTRYTTDFRGDRDNYNTGNRGFGGYTTGTRSTF